MKECAGHTENYSVVHTLPYGKHTECDVCKGEEINEHFSENTCSNVIIDAM